MPFLVAFFFISTPLKVDLLIDSHRSMDADIQQTILITARQASSVLVNACSIEKQFEAQHIPLDQCVYSLHAL
jgi:hypothetical protein